MRRASDNFRNSGAYTSPGTPEYGNSNSHTVDLPKTWSSEHGPLLPHSRRHFSSMAAPLTPFNNGRKPLPSKWDDAERWITSPNDIAFKNSSSIPQRRPKSKSGPLGPTPAGGGGGGSKVRNFMINSPLTTGVLLPEGFSVRFDESSASAKSSSLYAESSAMRRETSTPTYSQDDKVERCSEDVVSSLVLGETSRRDMATQMSHEGSGRSSSDERLSFSALPSSSTVPFSEIECCNSKDEVRDVQIDESVTELKRCKEQGLMKRGKKKKKKRKKDSSRNVGESSPFHWNASEGSIHFSMLQREEAKITAWENLQKAKAEADIRKLEMKLEEKRSSSMEKIMKKLRAKQAKAQAMRDSSSVSDRKAHETDRRRRTSLSNCFTCRRF